MKTILHALGVFSLFLLGGLLFGIFVDQILIYPHLKLNKVVPKPVNNLTVNLKPPITEVRLSNITSHSALIEWTTDRDTTGRLEACIFKESGSRCTPGEEDNTFTTKHKLAMKNLEPGETYDITVISTDKDDNQINLKLYSYLTTPLTINILPKDLEKPIINITAGTSGSTISWETNEPTTCKLLIWNNQYFKYSLNSDNQSTKYSIQLDPNVFQKKPYKYRITAEDLSGNISTSDEQTITLK